MSREVKNGKISSSLSSSSSSASSTKSPATTPSKENGHEEPKPEWGSRSVAIFEKIEQVGAGTYGKVYKAKNKFTGEIVALKKVRMDKEKEGFPITAIREIKILKELGHDNIVMLKEIVTSKEYNKGKGSIFMVFEYMDHDLTGLMDSPYAEQFTEPQIKCYMKQLLEGLYFCHKNNVLHRDIKGSNLLVNNKGQLKLADFGLARFFNENAPGPYTNHVITLWYRPPELLFGAKIYGPSVDMWSAGCILGELLLRKPMFPGKEEVQQLELIWKLCGSPSDENWAEVTDLPLYSMLRPQRVYKRRLREVFKNCSEKGQDLLEKLLCLDPKRRISAADALDHDFFWTDPMPSSPRLLPQYESCHEWQNKKRKLQMQQQQQQQQHDQTKRAKSENGTSHSSTNPPSTNTSASSQPPPPSSNPPPPSSYSSHSSSYGTYPSHHSDRLSYPPPTSSNHAPMSNLLNANAAPYVGHHQTASILSYPAHSHPTQSHSTHHGYGQQSTSQWPSSASSSSSLYRSAQSKPK